MASNESHSCRIWNGRVKEYPQLQGAASPCGSIVEVHGEGPEDGLWFSGTVCEVIPARTSSDSETYLVLYDDAERRRAIRREAIAASRLRFADPGHAKEAAAAAAAAVGPLGDLEHLRPVLGPGRLLKSGELCWFTDHTPHESLPLRAGTQRSFFRLVTSGVSAWYADHSTPNPLGVKPACPIIHGSKFTSCDSDEQGARGKIAQISSRYS